METATTTGANVPSIRQLTANWSNKLLRKHITDNGYNSLFSFDLADNAEFMRHCKMIADLGTNIMKREYRQFEIDDNNRRVLGFLIHYFNHSPIAEQVFPDRNYKLHKNLLILGNPGTGKTMIMQVFADYLKLLNLPKKYHNISVTQMMNYYKINGHIDRFTYNEEQGNKAFEGAPVAVCLNDIGIETEMQKSYGTSLTTVIDEFLFARYEIYQNRMINYHMTSNLSVEQFNSRFQDRLMDRFKTFNVIPLTGSSRR